MPLAASSVSTSASTGTLGSIVRQQSGVVLGVLPPITTGPTLWLVSLIRRAPLVLNVQDVYPDGVFKRAWMARLNRVLERFILRRATRLTALSEGQREALVARGVQRERVGVVPMWTDLEGVRPGEYGDSVEITITDAAERAAG